MDCCEGSISLPFVLNDKSYRLENEKSFVKPKIICISSSLENENSITTKSGSIFTQYLFEIINNPNLSLYEILQKIKLKLRIKQTANISSSRP